MISIRKALSACASAPCVSSAFTERHILITAVSFSCSLHKRANFKLPIEQLYFITKFIKQNVKASPKCIKIILFQNLCAFCKSTYNRVRPRFFDQVGHETMYASSANKHFFTKSCHRQTYKNYEQSRQKLGTILENKVS